MFDWLIELKKWLFELPAYTLDLILRPIADQINSLAPLTSTPAKFFTGISVDVLQLATLIGVPEGMTIIGAAYVIRFGLQLIPFVRLGS